MQSNVQMVVIFVATHVVAMLWSTASVYAHDSGEAACHAPIAQIADDRIDEKIRPADQIWLVDSRHLPYCGVASRENIAFEYQRHAGAGHWSDEDFKAFCVAESKCDRTLIYVHGNRIGPYEARQRGLRVYHALADQSQEDPSDPKSLRFVIFSWPSTRTHGVLRDVRLKATRSDPAAYYLAHLLSRMDPNAKISLAGYSFGARVITGALHILGGGGIDGLELDGFQLDGSTGVSRKPMCVVLMAAALNDDWLERDACHGRALSLVHRMLLLNNRCDPAMRRYRAVDRRGSPTALGRWGVASFTALGAEAEKIQQRDVCCEIGPSHDFVLYLRNPSLMAQAWQFLHCGAPPRRKKTEPRP